MKISKYCTNELIVCESTDNKYIFTKRYYNLDGTFRKEKTIDLNKSQVGRKYYSCVENAFQYLLNNEDYVTI